MHGPLPRACLLRERLTTRVCVIETFGHNENIGMDLVRTDGASCPGLSSPAEGRGQKCKPRAPGPSRVYPQPLGRGRSLLRADREEATNSVQNSAYVPSFILERGLSAGALWTLGAEEVFAVGRPVHCSIPGLSPLGASTRLSSWDGNQKYLLLLSSIPWWAKSSPTSSENTDPGRDHQWRLGY